MQFVFFIIGLFLTWKTGPFVLFSVISFSDIACLISIFMYLFHIAKHLAFYKKILKPRIGILIFIIFTVYVLNSAFFAYNANFKGPNFTNFVTMALVFASAFSMYQVCGYLFQSKKTERYIEICAIGMLSGLILPFILTTVNITPHASVFFFPGDRYKGFLPHMNIMGILSSFLFTYFLFAKRDGVGKFLMLTIATIPLLLCSSKFNFALMAGITSAYYLYRVLPVPQIVRLAIIGLLGVLATQFTPFLIQVGAKILVTVNPEAARRIDAFVANPEGSETLNDRIYIWREAIDVGMANQPFGIGVAEAPVYLKGLSHAHNAVLNNFLVYGLPGLLYILTILWLFTFLVFRNTVANPTVRAVGACCCIAFISSSISDSFSATTSAVALTLAAMGWGLLSKLHSPKSLAQAIGS